MSQVKVKLIQMYQTALSYTRIIQTFHSFSGKDFPIYKRVSFINGIFEEKWNNENHCKFDNGHTAIPA